MTFQLFSRHVTCFLKSCLPRKEVQQILSQRSRFLRSSQHVQSVSTFSNAGFDIQTEHLNKTCPRCCMCNGTVPKSRVPTLIQMRHFAQDSTKKEELVKKEFEKFDYSGDLQNLQPLNPSDTLFVFENVEELKDAPEVIQKLCSIGFADNNQKKFHRIFAMRKKIKEKCGVEYKREMIIADMTLQIRATVDHLTKCPKDMQAKRFVVEKIAKRKRELRRLRHEDYERFMWLLKELQIKFVAPPAYYKHESKFALRKRLAREDAYAMKKEKVAELKERLESEKEKFFEHKVEVLAEIEADLAKFNINKDDVLQNVEKERRRKLDLDF